MAVYLKSLAERIEKLLGRLRRSAPPRAVDLKSLAERIEKRCILRGDYTLNSGKHSEYFYDGKRALLAADLKIDIAEAMLERSRDIEYEVIGGLAIGSVPISESMSVFALLHGKRSIDTFYVRDERKQWGNREKIFQAYAGDGPMPVLRGARVLVVDDVVTTGESIREAIKEIEAAGATVVAVSVIVDRKDPDAGWLRGRYDYRPLFEADAGGRLSVARQRSGAPTAPTA